MHLGNQKVVYKVGSHILPWIFLDSKSMQIRHIRNGLHIAPSDHMDHNLVVHHTDVVQHTYWLPNDEQNHLDTNISQYKIGQ